MDKNKDIPKLYDLDLEKEYFNNILQISEEYLTFINSYHKLTKEYIKGLNNSQKTFEQKIKDTKNLLKYNKNVNLSFFFALIDSLPTINKSFIDNLKLLIKGREKTKVELNNFIKEKQILLNKFLNNLNDSKNDLKLKINDIEKEKIIFFDNLSQTEKTVSDFYKNKIKIENYNKDNNKNNQHNSNNLKNLFIQNTNLEDIMNKSINETKKQEKDYKSLISISKVFKKAYIDLSNITYENIRSILYELFNEIKKFIENKMILLKNCFAITLKEIDNILTKLILTKENNEKILKNLLLKSNIINDDEFPIDSQKYSLQIFNKNLNNNDKPIMKLEDGLNEIYLLDNDLDFYIAKIMLSNFSYIEDEYKINFKEEEEKRNTKSIISNILSNIGKKSKKTENVIDTNNAYNNINDNKELKNVHENDINQLYTLLDKHNNRVVFLQTISQFRTSGKYCLPQKVFDIISYCLFIIINTIMRDEDYHCAKSTIILSQTYFYLKDNKRVYLHNLIKKHKLFFNLEFWKNTLEISIKKEIIRAQIYEKKKNKIKNKSDNIEIENEKEINYEKYSDIAFGQIASITNSMIDFDINIKDIRSIIEPKEKLYKLNQNHIKNIELIINNKLNTNDNEEKEKIENKKNNENIKNDININNNEINTNHINNNENKQDDIVNKMKNE